MSYVYVSHHRRSLSILQGPAPGFGVRFPNVDLAGRARPYDGLLVFALVFFLGLTHGYYLREPDFLPEQSGEVDRIDLSSYLDLVPVTDQFHRLNS